MIPPLNHVYSILLHDIMVLNIEMQLRLFAPSLLGSAKRTAASAASRRRSRCCKVRTIESCLQYLVTWYNERIGLSAAWL